MYSTYCEHRTHLLASLWRHSLIVTGWKQLLVRKKTRASFDLFFGKSEIRACIESTARYQCTPMGNLHGQCSCLVSCLPWTKLNCDQVTEVFRLLLTTIAALFSCPYSWMLLLLLLLLLLSFNIALLHTHTHTYTHIHAHIHACIHTQVNLSCLLSNTLFAAGCCLILRTFSCSRFSNHFVLKNSTQVFRFIWTLSASSCSTRDLTTIIC